MFVDEATRARIQTVYNFDGPGFNEATIPPRNSARWICASARSCRNPR
ncbi:MAG: Mbeg1-like protein [Christensenellales bacterium]